MKKSPTTISRRTTLFLGISSYYVSSIGGIAIVKYLNYEYCFTSWFVIALVSTSSWMISFPLNFILEKYEGIQVKVSWTELKIYLFLSIGLAIVALMNSFAMSTLPGLWYALVKSSNIGFSIILSVSVLNKRYHWGQMIGAAFVMGGIGWTFCVLLLLGSSTTVDDENASSSSSSAEMSPYKSWPFASLIALGGAFLNAFCNVITEATLKQTYAEEADQVIERIDATTATTSPSKLLLSNSFLAWTSLFSFLILTVPTILFGEARTADEEDTDLGCGVVVPRSDKHVGYIVSLSLLLLAVSRLGERLSKHWICAVDSAVTFSLVAALRRISGVFILAALFHESFPNGVVMGSCASAMGFLLYFWYSDTPPAESVGVNPMIRIQEYQLVATTAPVEEDNDFHKLNSLQPSQEDNWYDND